MEISQELLNKRRKYYSQIFIQFELLKAMKDREVMFISKSNPSYVIRGLFIKKINFLNDVFNMFHFYEKDYNIYVSNASYSFLPTFDFDLTQRAKETKPFFENEVYKYIYDYDILLDFDVNKDSNNFMEVLSEVRKVWQILYTNGIVFNCFPSGTGIQMIIPSRQMSINKKFFKYDKEELNEEEKRQPFNYNIKLLTKNIKGMFRLDSLCTVNIGTINKMRKCEYSLVNDSIVLPVNSISQIEEYKLIRFDCASLIHHIPFKNRGLCYHNTQFATDNLTPFIKKYNLDGNIKWE